jgi:eukaryotic-like serine/threonine-protein kinase
VTLPAGTRLGPYEILSPLGAGGMGEVYRARDSRLQRDVAVKILPAGLTADPDRLRRFEQEARSAGVLNHPNILAIYDIGTHEGVPYVVSELLEGETLRERIGEAPLPPRKAAEIGLQVARGLSAAHERGIVHRDLKPENLFVTRDGHAKILDFGLAKLIHPEEREEAGMTNLPTTPARTEPGKIMGTASYMSPEQVRGAPADHRSDIFSFGAILYEMLAGRRAFGRETSVETMNAILKEEPPELSVTGRNIPPALERIIGHCLEKRPEDRFQSARDLAFDLEAISGHSEGAAPVAGRRTPARRRTGLALLGGTALLLLAAAAGYLAGKGSGAAAEAAPPSFQRLTYRRGFLTSAAFAPDGRTIYYAAEWEGKPGEIFSTRPESPESGSQGIEDADLVGISAGGELALLLHRRMNVGWMSEGTLARAPLTGGAPREIAEAIQSAAWSPDGKDLALIRRTLRGDKVEFPQGKVLLETPGWVSHVRVAPGGEGIAFLLHPQLGDDAGSVVLLDRNGKRTTLSEGWASLYGLAWSPDGKEIWFSATRGGLNRALYAVDLSGRLRLLVQIPGAVTLMDVSRDGRALISTMNARREIMGLRRGETAERNLSWLDWSFPSDLSPDGEKLLLTEQGAGAGAHYAVYLRDMDGSPAIRLGEGFGGGLSPDGKLAMVIGELSPARLLLLPTGPGDARAIPLEDLTAQYSGAWLPDGSGFLIQASRPGHGIQVFLQSLSGGSPRAVSPEGGQVAYGNVVSPDGKLLALVGADGKLALYPLDGGEPRTVKESGSKDLPLRWSSDGRYIYVQRLGERPAPVDRLDLVSGKREPWKKFLPADSSGVLDIGPILVSPDGLSYAYSFKRALSDLYLVTGLK